MGTYYIGVDIAEKLEKIPDCSIYLDPDLCLNDGANEFQEETITHLFSKTTDEFFVNTVMYASDEYFPGPSKCLAAFSKGLINLTPKYTNIVSEDENIASINLRCGRIEVMGDTRCELHSIDIDSNSVTWKACEKHSGVELSTDGISTEKMKEMADMEPLSLIGYELILIDEFNEIVETTPFISALNTKNAIKASLINATDLGDYDRPSL